MTPKLLSPPAPWSRREFLRHSFFSAGAMTTIAMAGSACAVAGEPDIKAGRRTRLGNIGELQSPDANGIRLPTGFSSRIVAVSGEIPNAGGNYPWHTFPDGGATFPTDDGGWIYVNNSEVPAIGGVGALRFDRRAQVVNAYPLLGLTTSNCAGGPTPWNTWLSCEEYALGTVWETFPYASIFQARRRPALGVFAHEAVAVDPHARLLYLTEDDGAGRFYRFVPSDRDWPVGAERPALASGRLQVLQFSELANNQYPPADFALNRPRAVEWIDAQSPLLAQTVVRGLAGKAARGSVFKGGEGLWWFEGIVYFSTKGDNRIWAYDHSMQTVEVIYDFAAAVAPDKILSGVDNLTVSRQGDVLVAEDGGDMQLCIITPNQQVLPLLQVVGQDDSEITGPAFSPNGRRLYFNSQRGGRRGAGNGITYEITLPFRA